MNNTASRILSGGNNTLGFHDPVIQSILKRPPEKSLFEVTKKSLLRRITTKQVLDREESPPLEEKSLDPGRVSIPAGEATNPKDWPTTRDR
jgi:hypothetical protein